MQNLRRTRNIRAGALAGMKKRTTALGVVGVLAVGGAVYAGTLLAPHPADAQQPAAAPPPTAAVQQGDLTGTKRIAGTLAYAGIRPFNGGVGGTITWLPNVGDVIDRGGVLYRVDNTPVILMIGDLPAWRTFESGMDDGPDVLQLEQNLKDLGYFDGEPDEKFRWSTEEAIIAWQKDTGQEQTGQIDLGRVVFAPRAVRISELTPLLGDKLPEGGALGKVSDGDKNVTANVNLVDQSMASAGTTVTITLPGGITTTGTITSVGTPQDQDGQNGKTTVIPIVITLADQSAAGAFQQATVGIDLVSATRTGVMSVPLNALIATGDKQYAVQVVGADGTIRTVPVTTGLFAGGRVEVTGDLQAGDRVVIPQI